jgi:hypothetical protein
MSPTPVYCKNHPARETLLHCNRCGDPYCIHCLVRTPVGYRCKTCLNIQQAGYYTATALDYALAGTAGFLASIIGGAIAVALGGFFILFQIFYAPAAGGAISEVIWRAIGKRRGHYIWLVSCAAFLLGSAFGAALFRVIPAMISARGGTGLLTGLLTLPLAGIGAFFNLGFLIYIVLAIGTVYARLR